MIEFFNLLDELCDEYGLTISARIKIIVYCIHTYNSDYIDDSNVNWLKLSKELNSLYNRQLLCHIRIIGNGYSVDNKFMNYRNIYVLNYLKKYSFKYCVVYDVDAECYNDYDKAVCDHLSKQNSILLEE